MTVTFWAKSVLDRCSFCFSLGQWETLPSFRRGSYCVWTLRHKMLSGILESFLKDAKEKENQRIPDAGVPWHWFSMCGSQQLPAAYQRFTLWSITVAKLRLGSGYEIILQFGGVTTLWGTVLKSRTFRKVENPVAWPADEGRRCSPPKGIRSKSFPSRVPYATWRISQNFWSRLSLFSFFPQQSVCQSLVFTRARKRESVTDLAKAISGSAAPPCG